MLELLKLLLCGRKLVCPARPDSGVKVRLRTMLDDVVMKLEGGGMLCYILLYIIQYNDFINCWETNRSSQTSRLSKYGGESCGRLDCADVPPSCC